MKYKQLLFTIMILLAGCSKPKPVTIITGNASTRTPGSPAVTGGRNVIIYQGDGDQAINAKRKWIVKADPSPFLKEEDWVCLSTGRIDDAQIVLGSSKVWTVYSHGANYGEFIDKGSALKQAERIATSKHLECD